jgi:hypothetical protein
MAAFSYDEARFNPAIAIISDDIPIVPLLPLLSFPSYFEDILNSIQAYLITISINECINGKEIKFSMEKHVNILARFKRYISILQPVKIFSSVISIAAPTLNLEYLR